MRHLAHRCGPRAAWSAGGETAPVEPRGRSPPSASNCNSALMCVLDGIATPVTGPDRKATFVPGGFPTSEMARIRGYCDVKLGRQFSTRISVSRTCLGLTQKVLDDSGQVENRFFAITTKRRPVHRREGYWFQGGEALQRAIRVWRVGHVFC